MRHLGSLRVYEPVLRELAARGHQVHLALGRAEALGWTRALDNLLAEQPAITSSWVTGSPAAFWAEVAKTLRLWADYVRYLEPEYAPFPKLRARAAEKVPPRLLRFADRPLFTLRENRRRLLRFVRTLERALPPVPEIERELREHRPDLVLVTPLVYLGSSQFEVLRTALEMGLRTAFSVGSWDHLSSKALIRDMPHRVLVWNDTQKDEAVRLHGVPADRVVVTGAQCYDEWFGRQPSRSREEFCAHVGLPADRPFILYVCSALFWGSPKEAAFVQRWVQALRESAHPELREAAVLIRPHPARMDEWNDVDLSRFPHVALYGSNPVDTSSKHDYFESLHYSSAIVGLNTSAFLEGAIVGRPLHTVLLPEYHDNQEGVLHFHYLFDVGGGVLQAARSVEEHHQQLAASVRGGGARRGDGFVRAFIRPHGLEQAATTAFCDAVEEALRMPAPVAERTPLTFVLLRWAMAPAFVVLRWIYGAELIRDDWSRKARERERSKAAKLKARGDRRRLEEAQREARLREEAAAKAARAATLRAREDARRRAEAEKTALKRAKAQAKAARTRRRERAALRARIKSEAARLLTPWRSRGEGQMR